ncbi:hypothetical protein KY290_014087 [Solanum tuberosum]|uniref:RNase H type-1 domain-containing protein n=1 Tax=Solanum tuberosum TaxID=4113 RepID=A0ABQ7VNN8_SOLTU|nr:hypothetical protein KY285_013513 [Solanum tuberosum]KAH0770106.1 hypothetical protein KY290_014087 [Solanum tuberosum]
MAKRFLVLELCGKYYNLPSAMGDLILEQLCRSTVGQMVLGGLLMLKWDNRIFRESGKTTNQNMVELSKTVEEPKDQFMSFHIIHVERELNTEADMLANLAVLLNRMLAFADGPMLPRKAIRVLMWTGKSGSGLQREESDSINKVKA